MVWPSCRIYVIRFVVWIYSRAHHVRIGYNNDSECGRSVHCSRYFSLYFVWFCWVSVFSKRRTCVRFFENSHRMVFKFKNDVFVSNVKKNLYKIPQYIFVISNISDRHLLSKILISHFLCIIKINQNREHEYKEKNDFRKFNFFRWTNEKVFRLHYNATDHLQIVYTNIRCL